MIKLLWGGVSVYILEHSPKEQPRDASRGNGVGTVQKLSSRQRKIPS